MQTFHYQNYWPRVIWSIPAAYVSIVLHTRLEPYITSDFLYFPLGIILTLLMVAAYWHMSANWPLFQNEGGFEIAPDGLLVHLRGRTIILTGIKAVSGWDANLFGSPMSVLQIRYANSSLKLFSLPRKSGQHFGDTDLFPLFQAAVRCGGDRLVQMKDMSGTPMPYHYVSKEYFHEDRS